VLGRCEVNVLGIDPGGTTGLAWVNATDECVEVLGWSQIDVRDDTGLAAFGDLMETLMDVNDVVAIERFFISPRTLTQTRQPDALYIIGLVKYLCLKLGPKFVMQSASDAKNIWTDDRLKANIDSGFLVGSPKKVKRHAIDALRHALLAARVVGTVPGS
jgi:hypothetical protein